jgi:hypothetical protein
MKNNNLKFYLLTLFLFLISISGYSQAQYTLSMTATAPTDRTIDVTLSITATNPSGLRFGGYQTGINFNTAIINGGTISAAYVPNSKSSPALDAMVIPTPGVATAGHVRLSLQALSGVNGVDMAQGTTLILGTYKITNTVPWSSGSNASLWLQNVLASGRTNSLVNGYPFGATTPATSYTTTSPIAGSLVLGYSSASPLSLPLNVVTQDCATIGNATTTPVTCFAGTDGTASINMSALTPSVSAITYTINGGSSIPATLVGGAFTLTGLAVGSYSIVVTNTGCPNITVPVTITGPTSPLTNTTNESACDSYLWSVTGLTYTSGGIYTGTSVNGSGCTINETLNLTITPVTTNGSVTTSICEGESYTWPANGVTYTTAQTDVTVVSGCNTATLNLTITPVTTNGSVTTSICEGESYTWPANGVTYTTAQTDVTVVSGCNTATLNLTITPVTTNGSVTTSICEGESYTWPVNGVTYTTAQTDVTVVSGCNTATLNLTITPVTTNGSVTTSICEGESYTWPANGVTYTTAQTDVTVVSGCNTATLNLTITPVTTNGSVTTSICAGESYTWPANGVTYTTTQTDVTVVSGCNTATLNLSITPVTTNGSVTTSICEGESYTWPANGVTYTTAQSGVTVVSGCNTATLNLSITPVTTNGSVTTSICEGESYTWPANGVTYTTAQSGVTVVSGCNTATLNLSITPVTTNGSVTTSICEGDSYTWPANGVTYTTAQSGVTVVSGCNTATLNLNVNTSPIPTGNQIQIFDVANLNEATVANLVVSPAEVIWYDSLADAQAGSNALSSTTVLISGASYWAVNVSGGCASIPFEVTVTVVLGVNGLYNDNFIYYPNPTSNLVNISYSNAITKVTVMNLLGQILQEIKSNALQVIVDLASYPSATYIFRIEANTNSQIIKVVKK